MLVYIQLLLFHLNGNVKTRHISNFLKEIYYIFVIFLLLFSLN